MINWTATGCHHFCGAKNSATQFRQVIMALGLSKLMAHDLQNLIEWIETNEIAVSTYLPDELLNHVVLDRVKVINNIIDAIKVGDLNAIELGCDLAIYNKHIPFGRTLKSNIFNALKSQVRFISKDFKGKLMQLAIMYLESDYPARESKSLCRLIKRFEPSYRQGIVSKVRANGEVTARWISYLKC